MTRTPQGTIQPPSGKRRRESRRLRLVDEVRHIQRRAAARDDRVVAIGELVLFSTETGDAWVLDPTDHLAARVARVWRDARRRERFACDPGRPLRD